MYNIQPLVGLVTGILVVGVSVYFRWKIDSAGGKKMNNIQRLASSMGLAFGGIMLILAIKFLTS